MKHAVRHVCVSHNTKKDLLAIYPDIKEETVLASSLGVGGSLHKCQIADIETFKREHGLHKPYLLFVGDRIGLTGAGQPGEGYKNSKILLEAFKKWKSSAMHMLLFVGGAKDIEQSIVENCHGLDWKHICPVDEGLALAYGGALAVVYPSKYEGFGLPVVEAMKCGCPVIAARTSSLPEVGGDAPIYIDPANGDELVDALDMVLDHENRQKMIERGMSQAAGMTWRKIAEDVWGELIKATEGSPGDAMPWRSVRSELAELEVIRNEAICVKNSLSWQVTYPLRAVSRRLSQLLGKQYRDL
jgi:glycosyltransferase involved in cell wall biosynthesis